MPEYAELHHSAHLVHSASVGFTFTRAMTRGYVHPKTGTVGVGDHERSPFQLLPATAEWARPFEIYARHRGKEVGIVLVQLKKNEERTVLASHDGRPCGPCCPTCDAIAQRSTPLEPRCEHGEIGVLQQVKKRSANCGRFFYSCYLPFGRRGRCSFFKWADDPCGASNTRSQIDALFQHQDHMGHVNLHSNALRAGGAEYDGSVAGAGGAAAPDGDVASTAGGVSVEVARLTFRRGMKGRFVLLTRQALEAEKAERQIGKAGAGYSGCSPQSVLSTAQVMFERCDGALLCFVDPRPRCSDTAVWQAGLWGSANCTNSRGPDPVHEYLEFRRNILDSLRSDIDTDAAGGGQEGAQGGRLGRRAGEGEREDEGGEREKGTRRRGVGGVVWECAICEVLLNQRFFNGVGNYVRAELLWEAKVPPFARARDVLLPLLREQPAGMRPYNTTRRCYARACVCVCVCVCVGVCGGGLQEY
jgi:hypothetical protein